MKALIDFFKARSSVRLYRLFWIASIAGVSNSLLLYILNAGAASAIHGGALGSLLVLFLTAQVIFVAAQRHLFLATTTEVEKVLHAYRIEQVERIRHCDLDALERIGRAKILGGLTRETHTISLASSAIMHGAQSVVVAFFALIYLAWLSLPALVLAIAILGLGAIAYVSRMDLAKAKLAEAAGEECLFFNSIDDLLEGFKEIRLNAQRSSDLANYIEAISRRLGDLT